MTVQGLRNNFRVYVFGKPPKYTKKDLDKIASRHISPLPSCLRKESDMDEWLAVYNAFRAAGLSTKRASEETDERKLWYD